MPIGAPLAIAVDDTLFRRSGRRVYAAHWGYVFDQVEAASGQAQFLAARSAHLPVGHENRCPVVG
jgi:hypothetical protein